MPDLKLPPRYTQVDPEWAAHILERHAADDRYTYAAASGTWQNCGRCGERWPCEIADLAATVLALYEVTASPPVRAG